MLLFQLYINKQRVNPVLLNETCYFNYISVIKGLNLKPDMAINVVFLLLDDILPCRPTHGKANEMGITDGIGCPLRL
jgi:hypothetical protein